MSLLELLELLELESQDFDTEPVNDIIVLDDVDLTNLENQEN